MFQNMMVAISTNLTATSTLVMGTNPTANDTVTINGVTFRFVASPANPGDVDIGGSAAASRTNLINAVNGGTGAGTDYIEVSTVNRTRLEGLTLTQNGTTAANIDFESKRGYKRVSSSLTANNNDWDEVVIHNILMEKGAIHLVMQKEVSLKIQDVHKQLATRYMTWARYGIKTFEEGAERMFDLAILSQVAES